eukprot:TRINITY_DN1050_c2_g5_i1.p1 TRINITY_DN1050_c2_g5~~TRINITY_DN1050_c2_g5_i1.p1  ORF type:complete len:501 (-),score=265.84 TRINITY_DN1050_c2_g5_i1:33-1535(-)
MNKFNIFFSLFVLFCGLTFAKNLISHQGFNAACCGATQVYDKDDSNYICCNGTLRFIDGQDSCCSSTAFDSSSQLCCSGTVVPMSPTAECCGAAPLKENFGCCAGKQFDLESQQCCDSGVIIGSSLTCCGSRGIPIDQQCCNGVGFIPSATRDCCGTEFTGATFDPTTSTCCSIEEANAQGVLVSRFAVARGASGTGTCCGLNSVLATATQFCCPNEGSSSARIVTPTTGQDQCCGTVAIDSTRQLCCTNSARSIVTTRDTDATTNDQCCFNSAGTSAVSFNADLQVCCASGSVVTQVPSSTLISCCGSTLYDPQHQVCCNNQVQCGDKCCGTNGYFELAEICCNGEVYQRFAENMGCCGSMAYDMDKYACCSGVLQDRHFANGACCLDFYYDPTSRTCCAPTDSVSSLKALRQLKKPGEYVGSEYVRCGNACCGLTGYNTQFAKCCKSTLFEADNNNIFACCDSELYRLLSDNLCCCSFSENKDQTQNSECSENTYELP